MLEAGKSRQGEPRDLRDNRAEALGVVDPVGGYEPYAAGQQGEQDQNETEQTDDTHCC